MWGKNSIARECAEILNDTTYVAGHLRGRARVENRHLFVDPVSSRIHGVRILRFSQTLEWDGKSPTVVVEYEHEEATVTESETE